MAFAVVAIVAQRNLFAVVVLSGVYSFLMATVLVALDAVDVAMTEASVGAGISTVLLLGALYLVGSEETKPMHRPWLPLALAVVTGGMIVYGTLGLPAFSDSSAPIHQHVAKRYIEEGAREHGRAEHRHGSARELPGLRHPRRNHGGVHRRRRRHRAPPPPPQVARGEEMRNYLVLRVIAKLLIPFMLVFALYVQFHGDYGPGGGFQAGVIAAAAMILYGVIYGLPTARKVIPDWVVETMLAAGVLIYAGVGIAGILLGGNYLDYFVLDHSPVHGQERGIFWVEAGVGITVAGVMLKIFYMFAGRRREDGDR